MCRHTGKVVWATNNDIQSASVRGLTHLGDGERVPLVPKDMGSCEVFPQVLKHNCNGRFLVVCGDGEYIIYTSQALRNKAFGQALDFVWSAVGTGDYAIRESISKVKIFKNFKEHMTIKAPLPAAEGLFGGMCLAIRSVECICFFDWSDGSFLCKIDVSPIAVHWNESRELVSLVCDEQAFILKFDHELVESSQSSGAMSPQAGVDGAFEPLHELPEKITAGQWVGDCLLYTNVAGRLSYFVGGNVLTICHLDAGSFYMLGYSPKEDRVFFMDRSQAVVSYRALLSVFQYQTAVVRQDFDAANALLPALPESDLSSVARFLENQGYKDVALQVSRDPDHKFDLALELSQLSTARSLLESVPAKDREQAEYRNKWKRLGDSALATCDLELAESCSRHAFDLPGLLMIHTSTGNRDGVMEVANLADSSERLNIAFVAFFILGNVEYCFEYTSLSQWVLFFCSAKSVAQ